jgi:hypothetical protein
MSEKYPLACIFCGAENWAKDTFSFSEQRAVANLRLIHSAEATFQATFGCGNYGAATELFRYTLIPKELAEALNAPKMQNELGVSCEGTNKPLSGYRFQLKTSLTTSEPANFVALALVDVETHRQGTWNFYLDESGVIRFSQKPQVAPNASSEIFDVELEQRVWR